MVAAKVKKRMNSDIKSLVFVSIETQPKCDRVQVRVPVQSQSVSGLIRRNQKWSWCLDDDAGVAYIKIKQFLDEAPKSA